MYKVILAPLLALTIALPTLAQTRPGDTPASSTATGEIRKVDKAAGKITIKHGEIKHLDMPPMTMVFHVKDAAALERFKVGDKINFVAKKNASGAFTAGDIQPAKP